MKHLRDAMLLMTAAAALIGSGCWLHLAALSTRVARRDALRQEERDLRGRIEHDHALACVERLRGQVRHHDDLVPRDESVSHLLKQLAHDLAELGVRDRALRMNPTRETGSFVTIPISLRFKGSFAATHELLRRLSTNERLVGVERISVKRAAEAPIDELLVVLDLNAFARPSEKGQ